MNDKTKKIIINFIVIVLILAGEITFFHNILLNDALIGYRIDSKLNTFFVEHWYQVFCGNETWTELGCFYPASHVLSYSDMMLGFAFPYAVFRSFGMNMYMALKWAVILIHVIGSFSMYYFMKKCLKVAEIPALIAVIAFSLSNGYYFVMVNVQMAYISILPLMFIFIYFYWKNLQNRRRFFYGLTALILLVMQFYTAFYVGYLFLLMILLSVPAVIITVLTCRKKIWMEVIFNSVKERWKDIISFMVLGVFLMIPFAYLYLPTLARTGGREWNDVLIFMPGIKQVLGIEEADKSLMALQQLDESKYNLTLGIPWIDLLIFFALFLTFIWIYCIRKREISDIVKVSIILLSLLIILLLPLGFEFQGHSLWYVIYRLIPGASAIRAVMRWYNLLTVPLAIVSGILVHKVFSDKIKGKQIFSLIIAVVIFFSNWFPTGTCSEWSVSEEEEFVLNVTPPPEDCEIMYLTDKGSTSDVIDAELQMDSWTIAQYFHIDTLNGYSGQEPQGWNVRVKDVKAAEEAEKWLRKNNIYDRNVYAYDIGSKEWTKLNYEE